MSERLRAVVAGAGGYVGGELLRWLSLHPHVSEVRALSDSFAGRAWSDAHPAALHLPPARFEPFAPEAVAGADVVFLAWPHGTSQQRIDAIEEVDPPLVVDLSADFRVRRRELYEPHYGPHVAAHRLDSFRYGLADVAGRDLAGARRIAAPGCFATAALLAIRPFAAHLAAPPIAFAATGSTGSGSTPRATTHHPRRAANLFAYAVTRHRHEAEIADQVRDWTGRDDLDPRLVPHSAPLVRGIGLALHARLVEPLSDPLAAVRAAYEGRPFVHVLERPSEVAPVSGTNRAHLHAAARAGGREVIVTATIDNLGKGAAGQAVQAMNLALGLEETSGLAWPGAFPC